MTQEEYRKEELEIFEDYKIPEEFHSALSYYAYERGHSAGCYEQALILRELCSTLAKSFKNLSDKYNKTI